MVQITLQTEHHPCPTKEQSPVIEMPPFFPLFLQATPYIGVALEAHFVHPFTLSEPPLPDCDVGYCQWSLSVRKDT